MAVCLPAKLKEPVRPVLALAIDRDMLSNLSYRIGLCKKERLFSKLALFKKYIVSILKINLKISTL